MSHAAKDELFPTGANRRWLGRLVRRFSAKYWRTAYENEKRERLRLANEKWWYKHRIEMLVKYQKQMRDPERTLVCDIIANGQLLPDFTGERYGPPNIPVRQPDQKS